MNATDSGAPVPGSLHDLFARLTISQSDQRPRMVDAILRHPELDRVLRAACGKILKRLPVHSDTREDLLQETLCLLGTALADEKLPYHDCGAARFRVWLHCVAMTTAERALVNSLPLSLQGFTLRDLDRLDVMTVPQPVVVIDLDDILVAISRMMDPLMRQVLKDWFLARLTLSQSAELRGISMTEIWRLRQRGREHLKHILLRDWFGAPAD